MGQAFKSVCCSVRRLYFGSKLKETCDKQSKKNNTIPMLDISPMAWPSADNCKISLEKQEIERFDAQLRVWICPVSKLDVVIISKWVPAFETILEAISLDNDEGKPGHETYMSNKGHKPLQTCDFNRSIVLRWPTMA